MVSAAFLPKCCEPREVTVGHLCDFAPTVTGTMQSGGGRCPRTDVPESHMQTRRKPLQHGSAHCSLLHQKQCESKDGGQTHTESSRGPPSAATLWLFLLNHLFQGQIIPSFGIRESRSGSHLGQISISLGGDDMVANRQIGTIKSSRLRPCLGDQVPCVFDAREGHSTPRRTNRKVEIPGVGQTYILASRQSRSRG